MFGVFGLGPTELVALALIGLLLFGNRLPELARSLGRTMKEVQRGMHGLEDELS
jgi:sec-independent protein translocase protein TatA